MPSPNSTFTELVSTTFRKHIGEIKDICKQIFNKLDGKADK